MSTHTAISPSSFERRALCAGSYHAEKDLPDVTSSYAAEGTLLHKAVEHLLNCASDKDFKSFELTLDTLQKQAVQDVYDYVIAIKDGIKLDEYRGDYIKEYIESKFDLSFLGAAISGTADYVIATRNELHIIDYKFGRGVKVDAIDNMQLELYALGYLISNQHSRDKIYLHIAQPFLNNYSMHITTTKDLLRKMPFYKKVVSDCLNENAIRTSSEKACKFCKARFTCTTLAENTMQVINRDLTEQMSDFEIKAILDNKKLILLHLKSIEEYVVDKLKNGGEFKGYDLKRKLSNRSWTKDAYDFLRKELGDDAFNKKLIGIGEAEKLLDKNEINKYTEKKEGELELIQL